MAPGPGRPTALAVANRRVGPRGGWLTGPGVDIEVFPLDEYAQRAEPQDYTRAVFGNLGR